MSSYTVTFTGNSSSLRSVLFPALRLQKGKLWEAALLDLTTYNSIPNITQNINNKLHFYKAVNKNGIPTKLEEISLPTGSYEIDDINEMLQEKMGKDNITIKGNNNTLRTEVKSKYYIDFSQPHSIGDLLGFPKTTPILKADETHSGERTVSIIQVNTINIICNIVHGSYVNGENSHILHTFYPSVPPGFRIIEKPHNLVYLPLNTSYISDIVLNILDQDGNLVDFREETITVRIHLKSSV